VLLVPSSTAHGARLAHGRAHVDWAFDGPFVSWEIYGASPISLGACTKYTHGTKYITPYEQGGVYEVYICTTRPRGKNIQVYYYSRKG
jgi:hypothetical protein